MVINNSDYLTVLILLQRLRWQFLHNSTPAVPTGGYPRVRWGSGGSLFLKICFVNYTLVLLVSLHLLPRPSLMKYNVTSLKTNSAALNRHSSSNKILYLFYFSLLYFYKIPGCYILPPLNYFRPRK